MLYILLLHGFAKLSRINTKEEYLILIKGKNAII